LDPDIQIIQKSNTENMSGQQISAYDKVKDNSEFLQWLHDLTVLGYDQKVIITADHQEVIAFYFIEGRTPLAALFRYTTEFLPRWNALTNTKN
jgi:hypothetical protein